MAAEEPQPRRWHPPREVLEVAELVLSGALPALPEAFVPPDGPLAVQRVILEDAEGTPVATLAAGSLSAGRPFSHGPLRSRRMTPEQVRAALGGVVGAPTGKVLAVAVSGALTGADVDAAARSAIDSGARILWLVLVGAGRRRDLPPEALLRAVRGAAEDVAGRGVPGLVVPVAVPLLDGGADRALLAAVASAHGAHDLIAPAGLAARDLGPVGPQVDGPQVDGPELDGPELNGPEAGGLKSVGPRSRDPESAVPALHPASSIEVARSVPPPHRRGVTVFFTGLSGSGKSTIAKGLAERLLDDGRRPVSMLDGDEVRRLLSHGLGFSRADRDLNIRRIGFVAAEVTRHGGLAICAPIAPFDAVRREVRALVEEGGDFVLVHVSTPLAECERRDRKGLYARARQGLMAEFTGISSPYEEPEDADLTIDTTALAVEEAVDLVWNLLVKTGYLG